MCLTTACESTRTRPSHSRGCRLRPSGKPWEREHQREHWEQWHVRGGGCDVRTTLTTFNGRGCNHLPCPCPCPCPCVVMSACGVVCMRDVCATTCTCVRVRVRVRLCPCVTMYSTVESLPGNPPLVDGHAYRAVLEVRNRAGLSSYVNASALMIHGACAPPPLPQRGTVAPPRCMLWLGSRDWCRTALRCLLS